MRNCKYLLFVFLTAVLLFLFVGCCTSHEVVVDAAIEATCVSEGLTEGSHCNKCGVVIQQQETISKLAHDVIVYKGIEPTCTSGGVSEGRECRTCGTVLAEIIELGVATDHPKEIVTGVEATCVSWGVTTQIKCYKCGFSQNHELVAPIEHNYVNEKCTVCQKEKIDYTNSFIYEAEGAYEFFETQPNGEAMRVFYDKLREDMTNFHNDKNANAVDQAGEFSIIPYYNYDRYTAGLSPDEIGITVSEFGKNNPLFYWLKINVMAQGRRVTVQPLVLDEYAKGEDRVKTNDTVYKTIEEYMTLVEGETSEYNIALILFDAIADRVEYAYDSEGNAEKSYWAHSTAGAFTKGKVVCEGYSDFYSLLLNACGVRNEIIGGSTLSGVMHVWNLVQMDDGKWYWFDLTWGDTNRSTNNYKWFCVTNDEFLKTHIVAEGNKRFLPAVSNTSFDDDEIWEINERIKIDGTMYALCDSKTVNRYGSKNDKGFVAYNGAVYIVKN